MKQGWIKLHRKLLENPICKKPNYVWLWIYLLLKANHKKEKFMWNGEVIIIKDGQLITGRKELSKETGIPETTIERALSHFEKNGHQIEQQKTTKYRIITILNWKTYQNADNKADNKRTTNGQQTDTNKNEENKENEKNKIATQGVVVNINPLIELFKEINPTYKRLYSNTTQRAALERLIKEFGEEELKKVLAVLPKINKIPYMVVSTTPYQLETNWGTIKAKMEQHFAKVADKKNKYIKII